MQYQTFHNESSSGKTRVWEVAVDGATIHTRHGYLGGKMVEGTDVGVVRFEGQSNEISAEADALNQVARLIDSKKRKGYWPANANKDDERASAIDWDHALPINLRVYKPDNTASATLLKVMEEGRAVYTRKRDGECMPVCIPETDQVDIYSRQMHPHHHLEDPAHPWAMRFPHLVDEFKSQNWPAKTILAGEVIRNQVNDDRWYVASILKTPTDEAIARQVADEKLSYCIWDLVYYGGENVLETKTFAERRAIIKRHVSETGYVQPVQAWSGEELELLDGVYDLSSIIAHPTYGSAVLEGDFPRQAKLAVALAIHFNWEGWVVVDPDEIYGSKALNFRGKDYRPSAVCGKLKPKFEDDFIAKFDPDNGQGSWGKGTRAGTVGAVSLYQLDEDGNEHYISECGGGLSLDDAAKLSDKSLYPLVLQCWYETRTYKSAGADTNALQFPRVVCIRTDKTTDECVNPRLA